VQINADLKNNKSVWMHKYAGAVRRSLAATLCEDEASEGGEPHGWGESDAEHGRELERPSSDARQAAGVAQAESWRRNIYASKPPRYSFSNKTTILLRKKD
jgi:hypothetical protein